MVAAGKVFSPPGAMIMPGRPPTKREESPARIEQEEFTHILHKDAEVFGMIPSS